MVLSWDLWVVGLKAGVAGFTDPGRGGKEGVAAPVSPFFDSMVNGKGGWRLGRAWGIGITERCAAAGSDGWTQDSRPGWCRS